MSNINSFDELVAAITAADASLQMHVSDDFAYSGASPGAVRTHLLAELSKPAADISDRTAGALRGILLSTLIGPKKSIGLGTKASKFGKGLQAATQTYARNMDVVYI